MGCNITLGPVRSQSQISLTDSILSGPVSPVDLKALLDEFKMNKIEAHDSKRKKKGSSLKSAHHHQNSSKSNGKTSSLDSLLLDFQGYPVISKLNPALLPQNANSLTSLSSISSELPPTARSVSVRSSPAFSRSSSICSEPPPLQERPFQTGYNFNVVQDENIDSDASDSETSMESTQTASDLFPLGEGYSPGGTSQGSFEAAAISSSSSLSSISSTCVFPKAKMELSSDDEKVTFSSASSSENSGVSFSSDSSDISSRSDSSIVSCHK
uniref:Uncharacterized protein n=1 Tax=Panagrolaimus sp. ES5 TaxID=591445 RepID=A0AC34F5Y7_9BILA